MSDSNDPQPGDINVGFDGTNITINNRPITDGDYTNLPTNSAELLGNENIKVYMMIRTICDIIKDATNARISVDRRVLVNTILNQIFDPRLVDIARGSTTLEEIKAISNNICKNFMSGRVFIKSAYTDHIPLPVQYVFNESGAEPDTFTPIGANIMSSFASVADPATRTAPTRCYPDYNPGYEQPLKFDASFMYDLVGFLSNTTWEATQTSEFDRNNSNNTKYSFSINVGSNVGSNGDIVRGVNVTNSNIAKTSFHGGGGGYYFQGNPTKNKIINNSINKNVTNIPEILRYMIIKEMGDMMQVYVMLVWFYLEIQNNPQMTKDKFVMSTTDLVVMNTCQLFKMPCLYTNQGKDTSLLSEQEKTDLKNMLEKKMDNKGTQIYNNWKKNNKFANTLYYLPFEESGELKKRRRLETLYYVIRSQNEKQLELFRLVSGDNQNNYNQLRYIKMGRLGPLLTYFNQNREENDQTLKRIIIDIIIPNIQMINWNLYHDCLEIYNSITGNETDDKYNNKNKFTCDEKDHVIRSKYSLNILITKQKYPPNSQSYIYVIQNLTHYTESYEIGLDENNKLVDMIINLELPEKYKNVEKDFEDTSIDINNELPKKLGETPIVVFPQITQNNLCGPNENWLIYSIANWFNGVRDQLNTMFGDVFQPFNFSSDLDTMNTMDWMGIGGADHKYNNEINGSNNLNQLYIHIGFVTMMPSIYEQLCSIYEKNDIVYDDVFGQTFIKVFISNLTRYGIQESDEIKSPILKAPYNDIDHLTRKEGINEDFPEPYFFNLIPDDDTHSPYEKQVIHTNDIEFDIKNIESIDDTDIDNAEFKQELIDELDIIKRISENNIDNNVFTVDDNFARELFKKSGLFFNEEVLTTPPGTPQTVTDVKGINSPEKLKTFLSPDKPENKEKLFYSIISPLKEKNISGLEYLNNISLDTIDNILSNGLPEILIEKLNEIIDDEKFDDNNLKYLIRKFIENEEIPDREAVASLGTELDESPSGGKFIKNQKTKRRIKRSRDKKHHKTNKKHKKHQKSGKNKTRKTKKPKRKNKTI
jgi:hypothetical protein